MNMATNETNDVQVPEVLFDERYNAIQPEVQALSPAQLSSISLDIPAAVATVLGVQPQVLDMQDDIAKRWRRLRRVPSSRYRMRARAARNDVCRRERAGEAGFGFRDPSACARRVWEERASMIAST
jgi:hypothetical protein